jgi:hypothetical protein
MIVIRGISDKGQPELIEETLQMLVQKANDYDDDEDEPNEDGEV